MWVWPVGKWVWLSRDNAHEMPITHIAYEGTLLGFFLVLCTLFSFPMMSFKFSKLLLHHAAVSSRRSLFTSTQLSYSAVANGILAIRREESSVWERRAPLNPNHVESLVRKGIKVLIQPSTRRAYSIPEYERSGATITDNIEDADVIIGRETHVHICIHVHVRT